MPVDKLLDGESGAVGYKNGKFIYVPIENALHGTRKFNVDEYNLAQRLSF